VIKQKNTIGQLLKEQRLVLSMSLKNLAEKVGISISYVTRIEKGNRFPSALVLRKIVRPLSLNEDELFRVAGFLSQPVAELPEPEGHFDPLVARVLAQETVWITTGSFDLS
jgi:transcriptional regulator with XRE-family HTH domain